VVVAVVVSTAVAAVAVVLVMASVVVVSATPIMMFVVSPVVVSVVPIGAAVVPAMVKTWVRMVTPVARVISAATGADEAVVSPAVRVSPVGPGADTQEDSVIEVAGAIESRRGAWVGRIVVIAVGANGRGADLNAEGNLRVCFWRGGQKGN